MQPNLWHGSVHENQEMYHFQVCTITVCYVIMYNFTSFKCTTEFCLGSIYAPKLVIFKTCSPLSALYMAFLLSEENTILIGNTKPIYRHILTLIQLGWISQISKRKGLEPFDFVFFNYKLNSFVHKNDLSYLLIFSPVRTDGGHNCLGSSKSYRTCNTQVTILLIYFTHTLMNLLTLLAN